MLPAAIKYQTLLGLHNATLGSHNVLAAVALDRLACRTTITVKAQNSPADRCTSNRGIQYSAEFAAVAITLQVMTLRSWSSKNKEPKSRSSSTKDVRVAAGHQLVDTSPPCQPP